MDVKIEAVEVHDFGPGGDEVADKLLVGVGGGVGMGGGGTEDRDSLGGDLEGVLRRCWARSCRWGAISRQFGLSPTVGSVQSRAEGPGWVGWCLVTLVHCAWIPQRDKRCEGHPCYWSLER